MTRFTWLIGDGVRIRSGQRIESAAVVLARLIRGLERPSKALMGSIIGDNFVVPLTG